LEFLTWTDAPAGSASVLFEEGRTIEGLEESGLMAAKVGNTALREIETLFAVGAIGGLSDGQLIERFLSGTRDETETAFAALVDRHGAMVMGVCRRLLSDSNDADDAFQATFLVLVRRAHSIARRDQLVNWLYRVAYQTARVARTRAAKRRAKERQVIDGLRARSTRDEAGCGDLLVHLDEELSRLPEKIRVPVVLCELEGQSRKEVALRLGIAEGTLSSRLARARKLLRDRLAKRGLALGAGALAAGLRHDVSAAAVRPALAKATVQAALRYATGGVVPRSVTSLTEGVLKTMFLTKLKAGAVVLLASCTMASLTTLATERVAALAAVASASPGPPQDPAADAAAKAEKPPAAGSDGVVQSKGRDLTPDGKLMYVNIYSNDKNVDRVSLHDFANVSILPKIQRTRGIGNATIPGNLVYPARIFLNPDRMRAHNVSSADVMKAISEQSMLGSPNLLGQATGKTSQSKEYVLTYIGGFNKLDQYASIVLKANPDGEILRVKDVGEVELGPRFFDIFSDVDGHPAAAIVLKQLPGWSAAIVIEAVKKNLEEIKAAAFPPGMNFEVIPLENQGMIYAVIETPPGSTLAYTSFKCHELEAIAKGIDEITSVSSLAGYQIRTEGRGSNAGTCLIQLKNRPDRKLTSRRIIEKLGEKCRTINVNLEFFEPPSVSVFVADGGVSVRVLDRTNSNNERLGRVPETFMDDLLKRKDLEGLFTFFASNYPQYELVINNDVAMQKRVSIANALENLPIVRGSDVQAEAKFRRLAAEDFANLFIKNDRGEMVPYSSFMQLKKKEGLNEINR
jgi:RNA polymerase sigma factor (sigma-70 family)